MLKSKFPILFAILLFRKGLCAFPPSLRYILPVLQNKIVDFNATCDANSLNITVEFEQPFKGLLFAKDFSQECGSIGTLSNVALIHLPTSGCGIRLSSNKNTKDNDENMYFLLTLVIQQDRHLRQITDQEKIVKCGVSGNSFALKSKPMIEEFKKELMKMRKEVTSRSGRMKDWQKGEIDEDIDKELNDALSAARAWMQVIPAKDESQENVLQVGEPALLMVKATLPVGIGWNVVDCNAHDGLGDSSQKLLDENGCPLDEMVMPALLKGPSKPMAMMKHQEAVSKFAAFKFPDRGRLHLSCILELCRDICQKVDCSNSSNSSSRYGRTILKGEMGEILDKLEVFNSVEVTAPEIELDNDLRDSSAKNKDPLSKLINISGDRTFCVSPNKIAITFCILGLIFLCAVVVAACALFRSRRGTNSTPYYTRSLFSSSSSGSGYGGSRLLIRDSPCSLPQSNRNFPYGKIF